jgi:NADPH:quinone reductase-like Zn-dependent oxidoreductase
VTAVCGTNNLSLIRSIGADWVIDYTRNDFTKGAERYDLIVDQVGNHSLSEYRHVLTPNGRYVLVGVAGSRPNEARWIGPFVRSLQAKLLRPFVSQKLETFRADLTQRDLNVLRDLVQAGKVRPVIDRRYKLSESAEAIRYLEEGHARGKVVITFEES